MRKLIQPVVAVILWGVASIGLGAAPEKYTLTNITGWSEAELATLPHFDRYVPVKPAGASSDFISVCANGMGLTAGDYGPTSTYTPPYGAFVESGTQTAIPSWGTFYWSYRVWDNNHWDVYSGTVNLSPVRAANLLGQVAGYATIPGSGDYSSDHDTHAYLRDTTTGEHLDLTPTAHRADPRDLNDLGEITGTWSDGSSSHPFRRSADGTFTEFVYNLPTSHAIAPAVINNHGVVGGKVTRHYVTGPEYDLFVSESGSATATLPYPSQASPDTGSIADINDHDVMVGEAHRAASPVEKSAVRWSRDGAAWIADDLNELLIDNLGFVLDRGRAVNDAGHIIVSGHDDDAPGDTLNTHRFLLSPVDEDENDVFPPPAVTTLPPRSITSTSAVMRGKINAANLATTWHFDHGTTAGYGDATATEDASGTAPVLGEVPLTGLQPHTTYHYRATGSNSEGATDGTDVAFTTAWDWSSWASANLSGGGPFDPLADTNENGLGDLFDYATGNALPPEFSIDPGQEIQVTFRHALLAEGVTLIVQVSDDLENWDDGSSYGFDTRVSSNAFSTELSRTPDGAEGETITVSVPAGAATCLFVRVVAVSS